MVTAKLLDSYFEALAAGDASLLPLSPHVRFTENGQELPLGKGLWATATGVSACRAIVVSDSGQGQVAGWGLVTEAGQEHLLAVRLKDGPAGVTEIETMVVRPADFGRAGTGFPDSLRAPYPGLLDPIEPGLRGSRAELIAAADGYFSGVSLDDADLIPVADDCIRVENGRQTVLNADAAGFSDDFELADGLKLSVADQVRRGDFHYIETIRDRRFVAVDPERGLVLAIVFFDHPGRIRATAYRSMFSSPNSMMIWETFKVIGGRIRHVEAIGTLFPYGMGASW
jgi:hypothetical protein